MSQMVDQVNGYDVYAKRAECDEDGNNIKTTYATKAELPDGVPDVTSSDDGKVLKATYSGGQGSYAWETESGGTVDQTYNASSTNAQSGTAVAGAIATVNQVPASTSADADKVLTVDSLGVPSWAVAPSQSTGLFEALYGTTTYADIVQAIADKKIVYCRISAYNAASRMAFLAYIGTGVSPKHIEFQYYRTNPTLTDSDSVFVYDVNENNNWTTTERSVERIQADWTEGSISAPSYIMNKPEDYTLVAGTGITITKDDVNKTITISLT